MTKGMQLVYAEVESREELSLHRARIERRAPHVETRSEWFEFTWGEHNKRRFELEDILEFAFTDYYDAGRDRWQVAVDRMIPESYDMLRYFIEIEFPMVERNAKALQRLLPLVELAEMVDDPDAFIERYAAELGPERAESERSSKWDWYADHDELCDDCRRELKLASQRERNAEALRRAVEKRDLP